MKKRTPGPSSMSALRPYMIEAFYKWICANNMTPLIAVDIALANSGLVAPVNFAVDNVLLLDLAPDATDDLVFGSVIRAQCYFEDGPTEVFVPVSAILAIYTQETQQGLFFEFEMDDELELLLEEERKFFEDMAAKKKSTRGTGSAHSRSHLQLVKPSRELKDESLD